jgi:hypothetical protein
MHSDKQTLRDSSSLPFFLDPPCSLVLLALLGDLLPLELEVLARFLLLLLQECFGVGVGELLTC